LRQHLKVLHTTALVRFPTRPPHHRWISHILLSRTSVLPIEGSTCRRHIDNWKFDTTISVSLFFDSFRENPQSQETHHNHFESPSFRFDPEKSPPEKSITPFRPPFWFWNPPSWSNFCYTSILLDEVLSTSWWLDRCFC